MVNYGRIVFKEGKGFTKMRNKIHTYNTIKCNTYHR